METTCVNRTQIEMKFIEIAVVFFFTRSLSVDWLVEARVARAVCLSQNEEKN